jgi:uncharacterized protein YacL
MEEPTQRPPTTQQGIAAAEEKNRQRTVLAILRSAFFVLAVTVTLLNIIDVSNNPNTGQEEVALATHWYLPLSAAIILFALFVAVDVLTPRKKIATLTGIAIGLIAGMVVTFAFAFVVDLIAQTWDLGDSPRIVGTVKILIGISLAYLGITTVLQTQEDFRLVIPYVEFSKQIRGTRPVLLDTSALIDARIIDVASTGVLQSPIVIPQFVIAELQRLADSADKLKRERGRRGLDVVRRLQRSPVDLTIDDHAVPGKAVDAMLVELAKSLPAKIITTDTGLSRVAEIRGVEIINLNALANALRPSLIPGETFTVRLVKEGEQSGQGVGYLADGTMVVAEDGEHLVGREVELTVTSAIQTANGRMIFGRAGNDLLDQPSAAPQPPTDDRPTADNQHQFENQPDNRPDSQHDHRPDQHPGQGEQSGSAHQPGTGQHSGTKPQTPPEQKIITQSASPEPSAEAEGQRPQRPAHPGRANRARNPRR